VSNEPVRAVVPQHVAAAAALGLAASLVGRCTWPALAVGAAAAAAGAAFVQAERAGLLAVAAAALVWRFAPRPAARDAPHRNVP
jgi:hypothetical protein